MLRLYDLSNNKNNTFTKKKMAIYYYNRIYYRKYDKSATTEKF